MAAVGEVHIPVRVHVQQNTGSTLKDVITAYLRSKGCQGPHTREGDDTELWHCPSLGVRTFSEVVEWVIVQERLETERTAEPVRAALF